MTKNAIVWTKSNSPACLEAIRTLRNLGYTVEERNVALHRPWSIADLRAAIPGAMTVPQIVIDDTVIGGVEAIASLPEAQEQAAARQAQRTARTERGSNGRQQWNKQQLREAKLEQRAAARAGRTDAIAARHAARAEAKANLTNTREERHAARDAKIQATLARRAAMQPVPPIAPEGYQTCAPKTATAEHKAMRVAEQIAKREAAVAEWRDATREARHARYNEINSRIYDKIAEQKAALN